MVKAALDDFTEACGNREPKLVPDEYAAALVVQMAFRDGDTGALDAWLLKIEEKRSGSKELAEAAVAAGAPLCKVVKRWCFMVEFFRKKTK